MTKISKNIKKARMAKNMTQDLLAEKLFVTRQTVSGWETGRTEPDVETLCKISEIFEVPVEELIYGENRPKTETEQKQNSKRLLMIVFSIFASVLTGAGLILLFVTGWENFSPTFKMILSFVPLLAGLTTTICIMKKHRESIPWRESASILLCAGITATVALVDLSFSLPTDFAECLLIDALLFLPVIYVLDAVAPLVIYYASTLYFVCDLIGPASKYSVLHASVVLYLAGLGYVIAYRKKQNDVRRTYALWLSVIAGSASLLVGIIDFEMSESMNLVVMTSYFLCLFIADKKDSWESPFKPVGLIGTLASTVAAVFILNPDVVSVSSMWYKYIYENNKIAFILIGVVSVIAVAACVLVFRKTFRNNTMKTVFCSVAGAYILLQTVCGFLFPMQKSMIVYLFILLLALAMSLTLTTYGIITGKFITLNIGLVSTAIVTGHIIFNLVEINMFAAGILLVLFGAILFAVNFLLSKKLKNK